MKVSIELSPEYSEPYAIIYADTCITLISSLSAYPSPPDTSHAYSLQAVSMNPTDYPYSRKSHNRIHRYAR